MKNAEFLDDIGLLLRLVEGLEGGNVTCSCRRTYRVGISAELRALLPRIRLEYLRRTGAAPEEVVPETGRFGLIEVD